MSDPEYDRLREEHERAMEEFGSAFCGAVAMKTYRRAIAAKQALSAYRDKASIPEPAPLRCEPPDGKDGQYWIENVAPDVDLLFGRIQVFDFFDGMWIDSVARGARIDPAVMSTEGWRYHSPAIPDTRIERERVAVAELMQTLELSEGQVIRQALAYYQMHVRRLRDGETCIYSGDQARAKEFIGDFPRPDSRPSDEEDMANVGRSLMDAIDAYQSHPLMKGWAPADDPAEIVGDLLNAYDEKADTRIPPSDEALYEWLKERQLEGNYYVQVLKDALAHFSPAQPTPTHQEITDQALLDFWKSFPALAGEILEVAAVRYLRAALARFAPGAYAGAQNQGRDHG